MAEHINSQQLVSSGSHEWIWGDKQRVGKTLGTPGVSGVFSYAISTGGRPGRIVGTLAVTAAGIAGCNIDMDALEAAIELLADSGLEVSWEDDKGHSGDHLVLLAYTRQGNRTYNVGKTTCWQRYALEIRENWGEL